MTTRRAWDICEVLSWKYDAWDVTGLQGYRVLLRDLWCECNDDYDSADDDERDLIVNLMIGIDRRLGDTREMLKKKGARV